MDFRDHVTLGRCGLSVSRLGIGASYGARAAAIEKAYREFAVNYFYWGSLRRGGMKRAVRNLARSERDKIVIALQSYDRTGVLMGRSLERGLQALGIEFADVLILGWHNRFPSRRLMDAARKLQERGAFRYLALSGHNRRFFGELARRGGECPFDILMIRYNAAHRGAETDIFPHLPKENRPGVTTYTATRWKQLLLASRMPAGESPLRASDCYRFALSNPNVDLCLSGPANAGQMDEALAALDKGPLSDEEMERVRRIGDFVYGSPPKTIQERTIG